MLVTSRLLTGIYYTYALITMKKTVAIFKTRLLQIAQYHLQQKSTFAYSNQKLKVK